MAMWRVSKGNLMAEVLLMMEAVAYLEHFTSAFTVTGCDERGMNIQEAMLLEEIMGRKGQGIAYSGYSANCVCPAGGADAVRHCRCNSGPVFLLKTREYTSIQMLPPINCSGAS